MTRPTFLIIGAFKCGTTSLHHYLGEHPQIQMSAIKETNFFSGPPNGTPYAAGSKRIKSLKEYEDLFDPAIAVRGESSPNYTVHPLRRGTPERITEVIPDAKLIYLVRDPIARTISHYKHRVARERERRSLQDALSDLSDPSSHYICPSLYASQLAHYLRYFSQDKILVIDQADLLADRHGTLREIFTFLSVDNSFVTPRFDEEINTGDELRTYSNFIVLVRRARASPLQRLPRGFRVGLRSSIERVASRPLETPSLDDDLRGRLQELYSPDVQRLRLLTGKTFPTWSV